MEDLVDHSKDYYTELLHVVMKPEYYKGVPLRNVLGRWQCGVKSFETKEELKKFIDTIKNYEI